MGFRCLSRPLAAEIDRAGAAAAPHADEVTVELAVSADGRLVPIPRRIGDTTSYVDIKKTLTRVDPLGPIRELLTEGWTLVRQPPRYNELAPSYRSIAVTDLLFNRHDLRGVLAAQEQVISEEVVSLDEN